MTVNTERFLVTAKYPTTLLASGFGASGFAGAFDFEKNQPGEDHRQIELSEQGISAVSIDRLVKAA